MRFPLLRNKRGAVLILVALGSFVLLGMAGLALDGGLAFINRAKLARAVDAASLAAARNLRAGQTNARNEAIAVAAANGVTIGGATTLTIVFGTNAQLQQTVQIRASRTIPLLFSRVLGQSQMTIAAVAEATVPPIDLALVVDRSWSLQDQNAWVPLQNAARNFVSLFSDAIDQMGLVSFQVRANGDVSLRQPFTSTINSSISAMTSIGYTNSGEGLRLGRAQLTAPNPVRPGAAKVVVFFTDGLPTATTGIYGGLARVIAVGSTNDGRIDGSATSPYTLPMGSWPSWNSCQNATTCYTLNELSVRAQARTDGLTQANLIRSDGTYIYTIALGSLTAGPLEQPDLAYLRTIANENGATNSSQPKGRSYYAPSAAQLNEVFQAVAKDLLVRLSR